MYIGLEGKTMGQAYIAAFLLPLPVTKDLTDDGWEFTSPRRLAEPVLEVLRRAFQAHHTETYPGFDVFEGEGLKISAARDSSGEIESIFVQLRERRPAELRSCIAEAGLDDIEIFVPSE
jgi:hypothetical protein